MLQWRLLFLGVVTIHSLFASAELELAEGTDPLGGCDVGGQQYEVGEEVPDESGDPCVRCFCEDDGRVACAMTQCDWVRCVDSVRPEGACCPVCPNGEYNCYAVFDYHYYRPQLQVWKFAVVGHVILP